MGGNTEVDARLSYDWERLYLIDIPLYPHLVGAIVEYEEASDILDGFDPRHDLKMRLLKENNWDVFSVKYSEFLKNPSSVAKNLVETLKEVKSDYSETTKSYTRAGYQGRYSERSEYQVRQYTIRLHAA
jgi:hypothetical protein